MNNHRLLTHQGVSTLSPIQGDGMRREGFMRSVVIDRNFCSNDQNIGMMKAMKESLDKVFGAPAESSDTFSKEK